MTEEDLADIGRALLTRLDGLETSVERATRRRTLLIVVGLVAALVVALLLWRLAAVQAQGVEQRQLIVECTAPGPNPPPVTGHRCYDEGLTRTADAVKGIVDADHDGKPDVQELRDDLARAGLTTTSLPSPTSPTSTTEPCDRTEQTCP